MQHEEERNFTDADVAAIAAALQEKIIKKFYQDLGQGIWALVWRAILFGLVAVAAYGAGRSIH